ncbi:MAG: hypothetical protein HY453_01180 [Parcubacteria group bacterium]|nr:hypothetical protein [Parcubacteria group bacterium]
MKIKFRFVLVTVTACATFFLMTATKAANHEITEILTPASRPFFYNLKIFGEDMTQMFFGVFSGNTERDYLKERIAERQAEMDIIRKKENWGEEYLRVANIRRRLEKTLDEKLIDAGEPIHLPIDFWEEGNLYSDATKNARLNTVRKRLAELDGVDENLTGEEIFLRNELAELESEKKMSDEFDMLFTLSRLSDKEYVEKLLKEKEKLSFAIETALEAAENNQSLYSGEFRENADVLDANKKLEASIRQAQMIFLDKNYALIDDAVRRMQNDLLEIAKVLEKQSYQSSVSNKTVAKTDDRKTPIPQPIVVDTKPAEKPIQKPKTPLTPLPTETEGSPLTLLGYYAGLSGQVNVYFSVNFGGQGGNPPYHFQLGSGVGFPPQGIVLDANGKLSGTPKIAGTSTFSVCVLDLSATSDCGTFTMIVTEAEKPETTPKTEVTLSLISRSCVGDKVQVIGRASGPVGTTFNSHYSDGPDCGSWTITPSSGCRREEGDPESTQWVYTFTKFRVSDDPQVIEIFFNDPQGIDVEKSIRYDKNC